MHKNIIFDCGMVLFTFSRSHLLDVYVGQDPVDREIVATAVYTNWNMQDTGLPSEDYYSMCIQGLPKKYHESIRNIIFHWDKEIAPIRKMTKIVKRLKKAGKTLLILSNMPDTFTYDHHYLPVTKEFDELFFSFDMKVAKPDIKAYEYILNKRNIKPEDCLFIDDNIDNIEGAKKAGIATYQFDYKHVKEFIKYIKHNEL